MLNFNIDISDTIKEFTLQPADVDSLCSYMLDRVVDEFMDKWLSLVDSKLDTSRDEYKRAMYTDRPDERTAIIGLTARESKLAMMIETGANAFDEKSGFANSPKRVMKKDGGWYLTIPFRHGTSGAIMNMMVPGMSVSILDLMKQGETITASTLPTPLNQPQTHQIQLNNGPLITYHHKAPIFEGMHRRNISSTGNERRGGYFTFRRVSDKTDEEAWLHPGFTAHNFMDTTLNTVQLDQVVDNAVQDWLDVKFS